VFAERISQLDSKRYDGGVFYAKDAFDASRMLDNLDNLKKNEISEVRIKKIEGVATTCENTPLPLEHAELIAPPFWGTSEVLVWSTENLLNTIDTERLFKAEWGGGRLDPSTYLATKEKEFDPAFQMLKKEILEQELIDARGFYGFFPVFTEKEQLIVLDPDDFSSELISFSFPRMPKKNNRSLIDYFRPEGDLVGVQLVSIGKKLGDRCRALFQKEDKYSRGFLLNGIGNYIVESIADKMTLEIRKVLGLGSKVGRRYSFGFPGLPSLEDQKKLFEMIGAEERLGITLTEGFQMDPEHSTLGIFVQHPEAEYLS
jgi:5-methyltetrahydrofolate--homocysteine methyltransferase